MRALVTGGAGFIGSNIVRLLLDNNHDVVVLDNLSTGYEKNLHGLKVKFVKGDILDESLLEDLFKGIDVVFHLAASIGNVKSLNDPAEDSRVNVVGTVNVLEAARKNKVGRIVYSSSAAIFGEPVELPIKEDHPQNPDSPYGVSKLAGEKQALCFAKLYDMIVVCLRYFNVYGVNQRYDAYGNVIPIFFNRLLAGKPLTIFGDGEQTRDFINVRDVAQANYLAATRAKETGVFNAGSGQSITVNQLARDIQEAAGISVPVENAPPRKGEVLHCRADISKLTKTLGFRAGSDMREGLRESFKWFSEDVSVKTR